MNDYMIDLAWCWRRLNLGKRRDRATYLKRKSFCDLAWYGMKHPFPSIDFLAEEIFVSP